MSDQEISETDIRHCFRDYDIRGLVDKQITPIFMQTLGKCFGSIVSRDRGKRIAIGYDARLSSPELSDALGNGITQSGIEVINIGCAPTPALYFADATLNVSASVMVTGSHNPPEYNGIKLVKNHLPFSGEDLRSLGKMVELKMQHNKSNPCDQPTPNVQQRLTVNIEKKYLQALIEHTNIRQQVRAVWDPGNGASSSIVSSLVKHIAGDHHVINGEIDGQFPNHHPDPTIEKNLSQLKETVRKGSYDIGFAFDGDGDRLVVVDKTGRTLSGDRVLTLLAVRHLKENPGEMVASDVKASDVFSEEVLRLGGTPLLCKTGHTNIKHAMHEYNIRLAGEVSGHFFFGHPWIGVDDAHLAALQVLQLCAANKKPISILYNELPHTFATSEIRVPYPDDEKFELIERVQKIVTRTALWKNLSVDGIRARNKDGWWLLRASNTEPMIVIRAESKSKLGLTSLKSSLIHFLVEAGAPKTLLKEALFGQ